MILNFINLFNNKWIRWSLYSFALLYLIFFRLDLDRDHLFVTSDGQIKYYQTLQIAKGEFSKSNCYYPGRDLDPDYNYYIFDYPWAFFYQNEMKCAFQYSPYFPSVASLVYNILGERYITVLPLVFWFLALIVFDLILILFSVRGWIQLFISLGLFFFGFLSLSALDYAELSMNDYLFVSGLYFLFKFIKISDDLSLLIEDNSRGKSVNRNTINIIGFVGFFSASILLRPEGFLVIFILLLSLLIVLRNKLLPIVFRLNFILPTIATGIALLSLFFMVNYLYSGNILGFRASNTGNDMKELYQFSKIGEGMIADLWKSEFKVGLFFALPVIFTIFPIMSLLSFKIRKSETNSDLLSLGNVIFISGLIAVISIPILSPYRAGYHHFGNRYFETAVIICFLGGGILWDKILKHKKSRKINWGILLIIFIMTFYSFKYTKEGMKVLNNSSVAYNDMQNSILVEFEDKKDLHYIPVVHKSLASNYLVGTSFNKQYHFLVTNENDYNQLEQLFIENKIIKFIEIEYMGTPIFMSDIPKKLYNEKINIKFAYQYSLYKTEKIHEMYGYSLKLLESK